MERTQLSKPCGAERSTICSAEQPVATVDELAQVRALVLKLQPFVLIAADGNPCVRPDPLRWRRRTPPMLAIVKAAPLGGVRRALKIVEQAGLPAVVIFGAGNLP